MHELSRRTSGLRRSGIIDRADASTGDTKGSAASIETIDLADGDPDFPTSRLIMEACIRALEDGQTHYIETGGLRSLREAIIETMGWAQLGYNQIENVVITPGSKFALNATLACIVDPGDSVIIIDPYWVSFDYMVRLSEGIPIHVSTQVEDRFFPNLAALDRKISPHTKAIIINSPNNPTARVYDRDEMSQLLEFAVKHNLYVISDEIYSNLEFEVPHISAAEIGHMYPRLIVVNSFSKAYAMTGWRVGYAVGDASLMEKVAQFQQHTVTCATSFVQHAISHVLSSGMMDEVITEVVDEFRRRREFVLTEFENVPAISLSAMEGAFYAWIQLGNIHLSSQAFAKRLLEVYGVAVVPGSVFGTSGEGYIRLCYARADEERLREAIRRFKDCVEEVTTDQINI